MSPLRSSSKSDAPIVGRLYPRARTALARTMTHLFFAVAVWGWLCPGVGTLFWLRMDQDKTNYPKRTGILLLFGVLQVMHYSPFICSANPTNKRVSLISHHNTGTSGFECCHFFVFLSHLFTVVLLLLSTWACRSVENPFITWCALGFSLFRRAPLCLRCSVFSVPSEDMIQQAYG